jgi:hypothetical protein
MEILREVLLLLLLLLLLLSRFRWCLVLAHENV